MLSPIVLTCRFSRPGTQSSLSGINEPFGFFDPLSFSKGVSKGIFRFYREAELKHGRIAMLAALGFPIGEQFHPLFGGEVDVPSYIAFQESSVQAFWPVLVLPIGAIELFTTFVSRRPLRPVEDGSDVNSVPGDLGFDPLGLRPESPEEFVEMCALLYAPRTPHPHATSACIYKDLHPHSSSPHAPLIRLRRRTLCCVLVLAGRQRSSITAALP